MLNKIRAKDRNFLPKMPKLKNSDVKHGLNLICFVGFIVQFSSMTKYYYSHPMQVNTVAIVPQYIQLPTFSFCFDWAVSRRRIQELYPKIYDQMTAANSSSRQKMNLLQALTVEQILRAMPNYEEDFRCKVRLPDNSLVACEFVSKVQRHTSYRWHCCTFFQHFHRDRNYYPIEMLHDSPLIKIHYDYTKARRKELLIIFHRSKESPQVTPGNLGLLGFDVSGGNVSDIYYRRTRVNVETRGEKYDSIDALVELMELELEIRTANSGVFVGGSVSGVGFLTFSHLVESQKSGNSMNISITGEPFAFSICN